MKEKKRFTKLESVERFFTEPEELPIEESKIEQIHEAPKIHEEYDIQDIRDIHEIQKIDDEQKKITVQEMLKIFQIKDVPKIQKKAGRPKQQGEFYHINLKIPLELKEPISDAAWRARKTVTQFINEAIKKELENGKKE